MTQGNGLPSSIRRPLALTWAGLWAERLTRAFWPVWTVLLVYAALALSGALLRLGFWPLLGVLGLCAAALAVLLYRGMMRFRRPRRQDALLRLDATLPGRPIAALTDTPAVGAGDPLSEALWQAHLIQMSARVKEARAVPPDLATRSRDPYALRYVAAVTVAMAALFGSFGQMDAVTGGGTAQASGPAWEGWVEPPAHTRMPALYLNDIPDGSLELMQGSRITLRLYGAEGTDLRETVSGQPVPDAADPAVPIRTRDFAVAQSGEVEVTGDAGRLWQVALRPDAAPTVSQDGEVEASPEGVMSLPFWAEDDYGITRGTAVFQLDLAAVTRRYGLTIDPERRPPLELDLPLSYSGNRLAFGEILQEDLSKHPWAQLPVQVVLQVEDAVGQVGRSGVLTFELPGRKFFDPMARAVIEARRDLLWNRQNTGRIADVMRAVTYRPEDVFRKMERYETLKELLVRLETAGPQMDDTVRDGLAEELWAYAIELEDGDLEDARERMRQAQERLSEAMRNGASPEEIERLMQELREATEDFMREMAERNGEEMDDDAQRGENTMELSQNDLQEMMDRIQQLMEEGRMAEAQQLLDQFMQMMENMQVQQGQGGQGQQALDQLGETLRDQQELSDEAFDELNRQENGQQQGQNGQQGEQGQEGQGGEGQSGDLGEQLSQRQRALRQELERQRQNLPGAGTDSGDQARRSLEDAGRAMDQAEEALRDQELGRAIDRQSEAIERLREGMRSLQDALDGQEQGQQQAGGQQGQGQPQSQGQPDPLGRREGNGNPMGTDDSLLQGEDVYRRAEELTEEIRRRSSEADRPEEERNYLNRLLDRF